MLIAIIEEYFDNIDNSYLEESDYNNQLYNFDFLNDDISKLIIDYNVKHPKKTYKQMSSDLNINTGKIGHTIRMFKYKNVRDVTKKLISNKSFTSHDSLISYIMQSLRKEGFKNNDKLAAQEFINYHMLKLEV